ncbi:cbb3-type cytochrome oxidase assembly protein CcoS [Coraliomargarita sp. SDUM461004]|uniref:Cbb3-type cytochrome oxidase assembly protein CcoS n=1 Tax=Thalassobacterium sedimentorum TaxID=3041258 RepID=A0ABU1AHA0_9BACT|nr:cbb3-type cytochrome oxidase assembly protein CcoS [Coraliomargarita sp. SDUM461004]MDQ8194192.1 cbb3-type cytochrome oxidase assembly protein CcoS [Coraliomargarita sp. SDUM461004]
MDVDNYTELLPLITLGVIFFIIAVSALYWSAKKGQLRNFDAQAKTIFTDEEPEGEISDSFPSKQKNKNN